VAGRVMRRCHRRTLRIKQGGLTGELRRRLKERFDAEGLDIPWPHTKVFFGNEPAALDS
jgi:small-conductance mechanosensitive channel